MKVIQTKIYEESKVILKLGEDFKIYHLHNFYSEEIFSLNSEMLTLIAKKNGFVKDYGGLGGLKTINVRSLGAQHVDTLRTIQQLVNLL